MDEVKFSRRLLPYIGVSDADACGEMARRVGQIIVAWWVASLTWDVIGRRVCRGYFRSIGGMHEQTDQ